MNGTRPPVLLEIDGLVPDELHTQTLHNRWRRGIHHEYERLARVVVHNAEVEADFCARLTWAMLAWKHPRRLDLMDLRDGSKVASVHSGQGSGTGQAGQVAYWYDYWLSSRSVPIADVERSDRKLSTFPPLRNGGDLLALNENAVGKREQILQSIDRVCGKHVTSFAYRLAQGFINFMRRAAAEPCRISPAVQRALHDLPGKRGESREASVVAIFTSRLSPGGVEKNVMDLAGALIGRGYTVHVVTTFGSENRWSTRTRELGVKVTHLPEFLPRACWFAYVADYVARNRVDVVHISNSHWMYEQVRALKSVSPQLRVVSQLHAEGRAGVRDYLNLAAEAGAAIDCHTVISRYLYGRVLARGGIAPQSLQVIRTGIEMTEEFRMSRFQKGDWRQLHGLPADTAIVAYVGRFSDIKRPLLFLEIAEEVLKKHPGTRFVMKGEGPLRAMIDRKLAKSPSLQAAVMVEGPNEPVQALMVDADLLLLTSAMEGIAYVCYEAMALGLVPVSTDVGGQSELIDPDCGVLIETGPGECHRFSAAVISLLEDPQHRARLSRAAVARMAGWQSVGDMAREYSGLYDKLVNQH